MRHVIVSNLVSMDGYIEDRQHRLDWHVVEEEFLEYARGLLAAVDGMLFGRLTYEHMASHWSSAPSDPIADRMNGLPKIVFSRSLEEATWENTRVVAGDAATEVRRLKAESGKDLVILGSSDLVTSLLADNLIDEYRMILTPVVLGGGKPHIGTLSHRIPMRLAGTRVLGSGVVILSYQKET